MLSIKTRQKYLKNLGFYKGKIDGVEGIKTKKAYKSLQTKYFTRKKDIDGVYGNNTEILLRNAERIRLYTKNFKLEEFKCECGGKYCTGYPKLISIRLLKNLQAVRTKFGTTTITSGLRCETYNNSLVGSVRGSKHTKGKAVDIYISKYSGLNGRKKVIDHFIKLISSNYSYCNGYYRTKWTKGSVNAPNMGNAIHIDVK